jgi:hypothetical protein
LSIQFVAAESEAESILVIVLIAEDYLYQRKMVIGKIVQPKRSFARAFGRNSFASMIGFTSQVPWEDIR